MKKITEKMFRQLLIHSRCLDKEILSNGIKHIQLDSPIVNKTHQSYYYLDAVYIGTDNKLHFLTSNEDGSDIQIKGIDDVYPQDLIRMYEYIQKNEQQ